MDRRLAISILATVITMPAPTMSAFAQSSPTSVSKRSGDTTVTMGEAEAKHAADTLAAGFLSLESSRIALKEAQHPKVREFAQFEVAEQETIADVLSSMRDRSSPPSGQVKASSKEVPQANLDANRKQMSEKLQQGEAGAGFDREYVRQQVQGHQQLLLIQETYLKDGKNHESLNVAKLMRGQINEHLVLLQDIEKQIIPKVAP